MKYAVLLIGSIAVAACGAPDDGSLFDTSSSASSNGAGQGGGPQASGGTTAAGTGGGEPEPTIGADQTVTAFDGAHVYFGPDNHRKVDAQVSFPEARALYDRVTLRLGLRCPDGRCDAWDRIGWISLLQGAGDAPTEIEVARFVTPYRVGGSWELDVTDLRPLLVGPITMRVFIDTWVGPGSPYGDGWLFDAAFDFHGGKPERQAVAAIPIWPPASHPHGDPDHPLSLSSTVALPVDAKAAAVRSFVTGHGQGNSDNCAEFCPLDHHIDIAGETRTRKVWRDDCATTAVPGQSGTYQFSRAGWCPGALVEPWTEELERAVAAGSSLDVAYGVQQYVNECRPDAPVCGGCTLGTGCEYDDGNHTEPRYYVSSLLVLYR